MKDRYVVVIRAFPGWSAYNIPCFIGQKTYKCKWIAKFVYHKWSKWSYRNAYKIKPADLSNMYPIAIMFGIIRSDGSWEITER